MGISITNQNLVPILKRRDHFLLHGSILGVLLILELFRPISSSWLSLNHNLTVEHHQWWRIITGHLVHLSWEHTLLNCSGLALILAIFLPIKRDPKVTHAPWQLISAATPPMVILFYLASALFTSFAIFIFNPGISNYVGLSGVLYGLLIFYLIAEFRITPTLSGTALLIIFAKIIWDLFHSGNAHSTAALIGGPVASVAHLYGGIAGLIIGVFAQFSHKRSATSK